MKWYNYCMHIVLSAHFDIAKPVPYIRLEDKAIHGLIDNIAGVFVAYQASRKTGVPVYFTNFEETGFGGATKVAKKLKKSDTLIIVVDTTTDAQGKDGYIGNAYNFDVTPLKPKYSKHIHFQDGLYEATEDETWIYGHKFGLKTFYFGVPIQRTYHDTNNAITQYAIEKASLYLCNIITNASKIAY